MPGDSLHESHGMIGLYHTNGRRRFFGSALGTHDHYMAIKIREGYEVANMGRKWFAGGKLVCEIRLSNAQFAEMITTPNMNDGIPCTFSFREGHGEIDEDPKLRDLEITQALTYAEEGTQEGIARLAEALKRVSNLLNGRGTVRKKDLEPIRTLLIQANNVFGGSDRNFYVEQVKKAASKVVVAAKAEVDATVTRFIHRLGLDALRDGRAAELEAVSENASLVLDVTPTGEANE